MSKAASKRSNPLHIGVNSHFPPPKKLGTLRLCPNWIVSWDSVAVATLMLVASNEYFPWLKLSIPFLCE